MLLGKLVEVGGEYATCQAALVATGGQRIELQEQALLQVARTHTRRLQLVNHGEHLFEFLDTHVHTQAERQIVGDGEQVATQVATIVNASHKIFGNGEFSLR